MKTFWEKIKSAMESDSDKEIRLAWENAEIEKEKAEKHLEKMNWNILSCHGMWCNYHFKIQKGDMIYKVTASEALRIF